MRKFALQEWVPSEEAEQEYIFSWAALMAGKHPELALLNASMNGILTDARFGAKLKRLGRKKGFPDLFLPVRNAAAAGLFIELKRKRGGVLSPEQVWWHEQLRAQGFAVEVCHGGPYAIRALERYLGISRAV
jgi:hypothetical protein